jgi:hypothetical protein
MPQLISDTQTMRKSINWVVSRPDVRHDDGTRKRGERVGPWGGLVQTDAKKTGELA